MKVQWKKRRELLWIPRHISQKFSFRRTEGWDSFLTVAFIVCRHTLKLVLRGEWPKLSPATKTHLSVTLQRCASHLVQHPAAPRCTALIALVHNPWTHPALDSILNGQPDSEHEEGRSHSHLFFSSYISRYTRFVVENEKESLSVAIVDEFHTFDLMEKNM